jgi:hypothetical protein
MSCATAEGHPRAGALNRDEHRRVDGVHLAGPGPGLTFTRGAPVPDAAPGNYRRGGTRGQHWSP